MLSRNDIPVDFRLSNKDDHNFIYATWLSSEKANTSAKLTPPKLYTEEQTHKIDLLLSKSQTMICYLDPTEQEPNQILLSYITYQYLNDHLIIHYAFTKSPFRKNGFQSYMLKLINVLNQPIVLSVEPDPKILKQLQHSNNIFYDHFYFQRSFLHGIQ